MPITFEDILRMTREEDLERERMMNTPIMSGPGGAIQGAGQFMTGLSSLLHAGRRKQLQNQMFEVAQKNNDFQNRLATLEMEKMSSDIDKKNEEVEKARKQRITSEALTKFRAKRMLSSAGLPSPELTPDEQTAIGMYNGRYVSGRDYLGPEMSQLPEFRGDLDEPVSVDEVRLRIERKRENYLKAKRAHEYKNEEIDRLKSKSPSERKSGLYKIVRESMAEYSNKFAMTDVVDNGDGTYSFAFEQDDKGRVIPNQFIGTQKFSEKEISRYQKKLAEDINRDILPVLRKTMKDSGFVPEDIDAFQDIDIAELLKKPVPERQSLMEFLKSKWNAILGRQTPPRREDLDNPRNPVVTKKSKSPISPGSEDQVAQSSKYPSINPEDNEPIKDYIGRLKSAGYPAGDAIEEAKRYYEYDEEDKRWARKKWDEFDVQEDAESQEPVASE